LIGLSQEVHSYSTQRLRLFKQEQKSCAINSQVISCTLLKEIAASLISYTNQAPRNDQLFFLFPCSSMATSHS